MTSTFENPIIPGFYPDPSICRVGGEYYLVTSSFEYFPGVPIFHSRDLTHWRQLGHALTRESQLPLHGAKSSQGIFAPTIRHHDGTFYIVTTNVSGGGSFYVTATDPAGEWSEPIWLKEPTFTMDPSLFFDADGRVYYTRHGGGERGAAYQTTLDIRTGRLESEPVPIWKGTGGVWPEGPHLYKRNGTYYLMLSEGGTGTGHMLTVARSRSPNGPFEPYSGNPILTHRDRPSEPIQATGHGDLVQDEDGNYWMVLLGVRRWDGQHHHLGRETFLTKVEWSADGWPVVNGGAPVTSRMMAQGLPAPQPWPEDAARDDFEELALELPWNFLRNPAPGSWSLQARRGFLRLMGRRASLDEVGAPAFVGRRQRHFQAQASLRLEFSPARDGERAGLTVRANEENHYDLSVELIGGERRVRVWTRTKGVSALIADAPAPLGPVELGVEAYPDRYEFVLGGFAPSNADARWLGQAPTAPLSSESAGGFTGVYLGMFASTLADGGMPPADFDWFEYRPVSSPA